MILFSPRLKAIQVPSGDQEGWRSRGLLVSRRMVPPFVMVTYKPDCSGRSDCQEKTIWLPSGEKLGDSSRPGKLVMLSCLAGGSGLRPPWLNHNPAAISGTAALAM